MVGCCVLTHTKWADIGSLFCTHLHNSHTHTHTHRATTANKTNKDEWVDTTNTIVLAFVFAGDGWLQSTQTHTQ